MGRIDTKLVVWTSVGLVFGLAVGGLWWKQTDRDTATRAALLVPERTATSAASMTPDHLAAPRVAREPLKAGAREHVVKDLQAQVVSLQAQVGQLRQDQAAGALRSPKAVTSPLRDQDSLAQALPLEQVEMQADAQAQEELELIEDTFSTETSNSEWTRTVELALEEASQHEGVAAIEFVAAECRATMCRLEVAGPNVPADGVIFGGGFRTLLHQLAWPGQIFGRIYNVDGEFPTAVMYLAREGYTLPQVTE